MLLKLRINPRLRQLRDVVWFILVVALAASLVVALLQTINLAAAGIVPWSGWLVNTLRYWAGDATGIGMLAPFLLILLRQVPCVWAHRESETERMNGTDNELSLPSRQGLLVLLVQIILLGGGIWVAFGAPRGVNLDYTYFVFLPLIWIALRYGLPKQQLFYVLTSL